MQVENRNSYNTLGRMGPVYPRPEYRPPQNAPENPAGAGADGAGKGAGGKAKAASEGLSLAPGLKRLLGKPNASQDAGGKMGAQAARELSEATASRIAALNPRDEYGCPHRMPEGRGLLYPVYA